MAPFSVHKRITRHEFRRALSHLREKGFADSQINEIKEIFRGDLDEARAVDGISDEDLTKAIHWLREHPFNHHFTPHNIQALDEVMRHYL